MQELQRYDADGKPRTLVVVFERMAKDDFSIRCQLRWLVRSFRMIHSICQMVLCFGVK
jgi:hypothetical protein